MNASQPEPRFFRNGKTAQIRRSPAQTLTIFDARLSGNRRQTVELLPARLVIFYPESSAS